MTTGVGVGKELRALLPGGVAGVVLGVCTAMIMLNHPVEPLDAPMPTFDEAPLAAVARDDREVRKRVDKQPLPPSVRALGSAYLEWNAVAASGVSPRDPRRETLGGEIRSALGIVRATYGDEVKMRPAMRDLRAYHADLFIDELHRRVRSKTVSDELKRLGGGLLEVLVANGWMDGGGDLRAPESIVRARYKLHWTSVVYDLEDCEHANPASCYGLTTLPLETAELRALLAYLIAHPVVRDEDTIAAGTPERAIDRRRLLYVDRLAAVDHYADPTGKTHPFTGDYPVPLARGALLHHLGRYDLAAAELGAYSNAHKEDVRARNWYLGAVAKMRGE